MKRRDIFIILSILLLIITIYLIYNANITQVETITVSRQSINKLVEETGYVEAVNDFTISAAVAGKITNLSLQSGDTVKEGDLIIVIDNPDLNIECESYLNSSYKIQADTDAAEIHRQDLKLKLEMAELDWVRKAKLYEQHAIAKAELENAELLVSNHKQALASQEAILKHLKSQLQITQNVHRELIRKKEQLQIKSPINGILLDLPVKNGDVVKPGDTLAQIGNKDQLQIKADLLIDDINEVKVGQKVYIKLPGEGNKQIIGQVKKIEPRAYTKISALGIEQKRVPVTIMFNETADLKPDYEVRIAIETASNSDTLVIPRECLKSLPDGDYMVWLVNNKNRIQARKIKTGIRNVLK